MLSDFPDPTPETEYEPEAHECPDRAYERERDAAPCPPLKRISVEGMREWSQLMRSHAIRLIEIHPRYEISGIEMLNRLDSFLQSLGGGK